MVASPIAFISILLGLLLCPVSGPSRHYREMRYLALMCLHRDRIGSRSESRSSYIRPRELLLSPFWCVAASHRSTRTPHISQPSGRAQSVPFSSPLCCFWSALSTSKERVWR